MRALRGPTGVVPTTRPGPNRPNRRIVEDGFAGDVIGLTNPGAFAIGDTIHAGSRVHFKPIPSFSPELFAYMRCAPNQRKPFQKGIEGACVCGGGGRGGTAGPLRGHGAGPMDLRTGGVLPLELLHFSLFGMRISF
jgi:hypothetical protein